MADFRTQLAIVLGAGLGVLLIAFPELVLRVHTVGRLPRDRGGSYGEEDSGSDRWHTVIRVIGLLMVGVAAYLWV